MNPIVTTERITGLFFKRIFQEHIRIMVGDEGIEP